VTLRVVRGIIGRAGQIGMLLVVGDMRVVIHGRVLPGTAPLVVCSDGMVGSCDGCEDEASSGVAEKAAT
jgi:hypothetical protein